MFSLNPLYDSSKSGTPASLNRCYIADLPSIADLPPGRSAMVLKNHCRPSPIAELPPYHLNRYRFSLYIFILLVVILWKKTCVADLPLADLPPGRSATLQAFPRKICSIADLPPEDLQHHRPSPKREGLQHCRSSPFIADLPRGKIYNIADLPLFL